jgi:hypothetical protein
LPVAPVLSCFHDPTFFFEILDRLVDSSSNALSFLSIFIVWIALFLVLLLFARFLWNFQQFSAHPVHKARESGGERGENDRHSPELNCRKEKGWQRRVNRRLRRRSNQLS